MVVELASIIGQPVFNNQGQKLGKVRSLAVDQKGILAGLVIKSGLVELSALPYEKITDFTSNNLVTSLERLDKASELIKIQQRAGLVLGLPAFTESRKALGKVQDLYLDVATGQIIRYYLRSLLQEQIIPEDLVSALTPKAVVFKDEVLTPVARPDTAKD